MTFTPTSEVKVSLNFSNDDIGTVGRLAVRDRKIYFEYDSQFVRQGLELSPYRLPLRPGLQSFDPHLFEGLPGLFDDSLPDGWGRLLVDRALRQEGVLPGQLTALDRLEFVGSSGMGALCYQPEFADPVDHENRIDLDRLAKQSRAVLSGEANDVLQELIALNGSSAGARPKGVIGVDRKRQRLCHPVAPLPEGYEHWLVKFPNAQDGIDAGAIEYVYALMAKDAGLPMMDVHLFPAKEGPGFFASKRFDRDGDSRRHVHSVCGLLHSDFRTPALDYKDLLTLTSGLTRDIREVEKMYRLAVFNVLAHNRDDHSRNFSFVMANNGEWHLSPPYDLTFSSGPGGEQSTTVLGQGSRPTLLNLMELGQDAGVEKSRITDAIDRTKAALDRWREWAREYGVADSNVELIAQRMGTIG